MIGTETSFSAELALRQREREIEAATRRSWLLAGTPKAERTLSYAVATWLRALAARLDPPREPTCCVQPA